MTEMVDQLRAEIQAAFDAAAAHGFDRDALAKILDESSLKQVHDLHDAGAMFHQFSLDQARSNPWFASAKGSAALHVYNVFTQRMKALAQERKPRELKRLILHRTVGDWERQVLFEVLEDRYLTTHDKTELARLREYTTDRPEYVTALVRGIRRR